jgi:hypothetical protein
MRRRTRKSAILLLFLLLGAAVNVAVAWGLVWRAQSDDLLDLISETLLVRREPLSTLKFEAGVARTWQTTRPMGMTWVNQIQILDEGQYHDLLPSWSAFARHDVSQCVHECFSAADPATSFSEVGAGFPLASFYGARAFGVFGQLEPQEFGFLQLPIALGGDLARMGDRHLTVPAWPLWPGFAVNTLFYAAILWLLFAARLLLPWWRRRRRIRRGLCPACAYPVGTSPVCTECGKAVAPGVVEAASP